MVIKEISNRRAVREYKSDPVSDEQIFEIIKAGQFAPSAKNNKAVEFVVVKNQETKDKIFEIAGQEFIKQAPVLIIPVSDPDKSLVPDCDIAVASENIFLQAIALGLGTVWKHLRPEWAEKIKPLIGISEKSIIINIIPIGYPKDAPPLHTDADFDINKIHRENW